MVTKYSIDPNNFDITAPLHPDALVGLRLFNMGEYYESHERLEDVWAEEKSDFRLVYQAIIQIAVVILHCQIKNFEGARQLGEKAQAKLVLFPPVTRGINVGKMRDDFDTLMNEVLRLGPERIGELNPAFFRPIEYDPNA